MPGLIASRSFEIPLDTLGVLRPHHPLSPGANEAVVRLTAMAGGWNSGALEVKRVVGAIESEPESFGIARTASANGTIELDFRLLADGPTTGLAFEVTTAAAGARVRVDITENG